MAKKSKRKAKVKKQVAADLVGKRSQFDRATWDAVDLMRREQMKDLPELTEEAFRDLLEEIRPQRRCPRGAQIIRPPRREEKGA